MKFFKRALRFLRLVGPDIEELRSYAKDLREGAEHYGLDHQPVILNEAEYCARCKRLALVFMQPLNICGKCWKARVNEAIEAATARGPN